MFYEHSSEFAGLPVVDYARGTAIQEPGQRCYALRVAYDDDETINGLLTALLEDPAADRLAGLVIGAWGQEMWETDSSGLVEALVAAAPRLASLRALFLGDIISEENEVSWIQQTDVSPLWAAFPRLEHVKIRGSQGLRLGQIGHAGLKSLTIECGGLPAAVLRELAESQLPALEHLELYLGTDNYGWDGSAEDLEPLLSGALFPRLRCLGLRDSEIADQVAAAVVNSPLLKRVKVLDLSLGTLTDEGAKHLLDSPAVKKLEKLDVHWNYLSPECVSRLEALPIEVDVSDQQEPHVYDDEVYRYVAVGE